jgi:hypothetical protein
MIVEVAFRVKNIVPCESAGLRDFFGTNVHFVTYRFSTERPGIGSWITNSKTKSFPASNPIRFGRVAVAARSPRCCGPCSIPEMALRCACSSASVESGAGPRIGRKAASVGDLCYAPSVGGLCYAPLTTAILAWRRIDFSTRLHWLRDRRKSGTPHAGHLMSVCCVNSFFIFDLSGHLSWGSLSANALLHATVLA